MFHAQSTFILNLHSRTAGPSIHFVRRIWVWKHCYWSKFWHQKGAKSWLIVVTTTHNMGTDGLTFILRINNNETQTHLRDDNGDCWKAVLSMLAGHPLSWNGSHKVTKWWPPALSSCPPQLRRWHSAPGASGWKSGFPTLVHAVSVISALRPDWSLNKETGEKTTSQCPKMMLTKPSEFKKLQRYVGRPIVGYILPSCANITALVILDPLGFLLRICLPFSLTFFCLWKFWMLLYFGTPSTPFIYQKVSERSS